MTIAVTDIFSRAAELLQDPSHTRWSLPSLLRWINDCQADIMTTYQHVTAERADLSLAEGTEQTLADTYTNLLKLHCNVTLVPVLDDSGQPLDPPETRRVAGTIVRPVTRDALDAIPGWQNPEVMPYNKTVQAVVDLKETTDQFTVFPGNDGTGMIQALVAVRLDDLATDGSGDVDLVSSYTDLEIAIDAKYRPAVVSYVVSRAFAGDLDVPGAFNREQLNMAMYHRMLGGSQMADRIWTPDMQDRQQPQPRRVVEGDG